jgi:predicted lactoylglutathione lyase
MIKRDAETNGSTKVFVNLPVKDLKETLTHYKWKLAYKRDAYH